MEAIILCAKNNKHVRLSMICCYVNKIEKYYYAIYDEETPYCIVVTPN